MSMEERLQQCKVDLSNPKECCKKDMWEVCSSALKSFIRQEVRNGILEYDREVIGQVETINGNGLKYTYQLLDPEKRTAALKKVKGEGNG